MRVFLDANVLFSASNQGSNMARLIRYLKKEHQVLTSNYAREEAYRNLCAKMPSWKSGLSDVLDGIDQVKSVDASCPVEIVAKDRPILATSIAARAEILLTGDKRDFGHLFGRRVEGVLVMTPRMFLETLEKGGF